MNWQPIETAPCTDTFALVCWRDGTVTIEDLDHDSDPAWWAERGATHWMLCPEHPAVPKVARDGIEAQRGLNDTWPGDSYP